MRRDDNDNLPAIMSGYAKLHGKRRTFLYVSVSPPPPDRRRRARHYEPSKFISAMSNDSAKSSVCLTRSDTLKRRASESLGSNALHGKVFIFKCPAERGCLLFRRTTQGKKEEIHRERFQSGLSLDRDFTVVKYLTISIMW